MRVNGLAYSLPSCVTIDEVYGERPGPCSEPTESTNHCDSKQASSSDLDYFENVLVQVMVEDLTR